MLNKGKKRTTRVEQAGPISDRESMRRQIETKNRRLNQDGRTKVIPSESASHPLFANMVNQESASNPTFDPSNTTNDSFGPTSLYAESNDSAHSEHTSEQNNDIDLIQSTPVEAMNNEDVYVAEIGEHDAPVAPQTPSKSLEPTRKSGRRVKKPSSFKDSVLTTIKSKSKFLIKKSGVLSNPQAVIQPINKLKSGKSKSGESGHEGPEVYKEEDENEFQIEIENENENYNDEEVSEKTESDDTSSTDDEDDEEGDKDMQDEDKKLKKKKKKEKKKDKKNKKDKKKKKDKAGKEKKGKDKKHNKSKEEEKRSKKRKADELAPLSDSLTKQPSLNKVFDGIIGESITSERSPYTDGSDQPKKKKRKREVENLRVGWARVDTAVTEPDGEGILSGSLDTKEKKSKRKRTAVEAEAHAESKKRKLEAIVEKEKKTWNVSCHYCRLSQNSKKQVSHNVFYVNCTGCSNTFCRPCIEGPIGLNFDETIKLVNWLCQCCTRDCCCHFPMGDCPRTNTEGHQHCFTYKQKVKKEQTVAVPKEPEVIPHVAVATPIVTPKSYTPVIKLKDSGSQKKKKRTDHTFVPKLSNSKGDFREAGSSEEDDFEKQPVIVHKKEKHRTSKKQKDHSGEEVYKKRVKEEVDFEGKNALLAGKSLSSAYSNIAVSPSRPRARAKTKKLIQAEDDQAQRKQRTMEKKLTVEEENDIALELVSVQDQISYYIDSIQAEIKVCDLALNQMPKVDVLPNPLEFTYVSNFGKMKRNSRLYGDDESSEISDFSDSGLSSWTDSLVESFEESEFEKESEIPSAAIKV